MSETLGWELNLTVVAFIRMRDCDPNPVQLQPFYRCPNKQENKQSNKKYRPFSNQPTCIIFGWFLTWDGHSGQGRRASSSIRSSLYYSMHFVQKGREEGNGKCCKSERSLPLLYLPRVGMWCLLYYVVTVANLAIGFCQTYGIRMVLSNCLFDLGFRIDVQENALSPSSTCQE